MTWDIAVVDFGPNPPSLLENLDTMKQRPMGTPLEVQSKMDAYLPGIRWSGPTDGIYIGDNVAFEIHMDDKPLVKTIILHATGQGDIVGALLAFAKPNSWSLIDDDCSYIGADPPSGEGS